MKKFFNVLTIALSVFLALFCIGGSAISYVKLINNRSQLKESITEASFDYQLLFDDTIDESTTLIFNSMAEYQAYLASMPQATSTYSMHNYGVSSSSHMPGNVPDDIELSSIMVDDSGTVFTYSVGRNVNLINFNTDDAVIIEMSQTLIQKEIQREEITNHREYAQNLATSIGASTVTSCSTHAIYAGEVYADIYNTDTGELERVKIGTQKIFFVIETDTDFDGRILYYYYPVTMTENEFAEFANLPSFIDLQD